MIKSFFSLLVSPLVFFLLFTSNSYAGQAILVCDPPEIFTDVIGYQVDYGTALARGLRSETAWGNRIAQGSGPAMKAWKRL